ncbi:hypothetical protein EDB85DRAFT_1891355 [Lactarius pseudohatsudake]|nr:hypothetical protein EDB85DRAFT_1891355 [Lactarius pseudohatsudake]
MPYSTDEGQKRRRRGAPPHFGGANMIETAQAIADMDGRDLAERFYTPVFPPNGCSGLLQTEGLFVAHVRTGRGVDLRDVPAGRLTPQKLDAGDDADSAHSLRVTGRTPEGRQEPGRYWRKRTRTRPGRSGGCHWVESRTQSLRGNEKTRATC